MFAQCCRFRVLHRRLEFTSPPGFPLLRYTALPPPPLITSRGVPAAGHGLRWRPKQSPGAEDALVEQGDASPLLTHSVVQLQFSCRDSSFSGQINLPNIDPKLATICYHYGLNLLPQEKTGVTLFCFRDGA